MELINFNSSMKNIPIAGIKEVRIQGMHSVKEFMDRAKWRAGFVLNPDWKSEKKETYGFRSLAAPPQIKELEELQDKLADMIANLKFKEAPIRNNLQDKLRRDIKEINRNDKVFVKADKTSNFYKVEVDAYENLLHSSITTVYRKTDDAKVGEIEAEALKIAKKLELDDRIFKTSKREATITLKDHKPRFRENPTVRLINPTKPELGRASKRILSRVVSEVKKKTQFNQWKSTNATTKWFKERYNEQPNKNKLNFIQCDIEAFYPNISQELLTNSLNWAANFTTITDEEREIITHSKRSVLYFKGTPWVKQEDPDFDIGMGAFDGAECCDLVGLFLLSQMQHLNIAIGLYRDDCLAMSKQPHQKAEPTGTERAPQDLQPQRPEDPRSRGEQKGGGLPQRDAGPELGELQDVREGGGHAGLRQQGQQPPPLHHQKPAQGDQQTPLRYQLNGGALRGLRPSLPESPGRGRLQAQAVISAESRGGASGSKWEEQKAQSDMVQPALLVQLHHQHPQSLHGHHCRMLPTRPHTEKLFQCKHGESEL